MIEFIVIPEGVVTTSDLFKYISRLKSIHPSEVSNHIPCISFVGWINFVMHPRIIAKSSFDPKQFFVYRSENDRAVECGMFFTRGQYVALGSIEKIEKEISSSDKGGSLRAAEKSMPIG